MNVSEKIRRLSQNTTKMSFCRVASQMDDMRRCNVKARVGSVGVLIRKEKRFQGQEQLRF